MLHLLLLLKTKGLKIEQPQKETGGKKKKKEKRQQKLQKFRMALLSHLLLESNGHRPLSVLLLLLSIPRA